MLKESPDHLDADLIIKLYDLRRESVMREARKKLGAEFWPRSAEEALAVLKGDHPLNTAWRQVAGYWEMVYSMARHGIINGDFLVENNGEGLLLFAKVEPYLEALRKATSPRTMRNAEWVARNTEMGAQTLESFRNRVAARLKASS
ncbi:MAG TPA: hypothetical protein VJN95_04580 [Gemmatimonadales bacterium]|nr:hypothetical protein [Gemmatimonadales bacterium]